MSDKKNPRAKGEGPSDAEKGANKLIDLLGASGTGLEKLDIAREVLRDPDSLGSSEDDGAQTVVDHLKRRNEGGRYDATIAKAEQFRNDLDDKAGVTRKTEPAFDPRATAPGTVPAAPHPRGDK